MQKSIGQRFKILLKSLGLKQTEFCNAAQLNQGGFSRILNDQSIPRFDTIEAVYRAYPQINAHWFLTGEGDPIGSAPTPTSPDKVSELDREITHLQDKIKMQEKIIAMLESNATQK